MYEGSCVILFRVKACFLVSGCSVSEYSTFYNSKISFSLVTQHRFDRDWKKIEVFVGSKTVIQVFQIAKFGPPICIFGLLKLYSSLNQMKILKYLKLKIKRKNFKFC